MGAQPKTIGGGSATQTGNAFQDFLMQQMTGQQNSGAQQQLAQLQAMYNSPGSQFGNRGAMQADIARLQNQVNQPNQQTSAFQNAFNSQLGGNVPDPSGANAAIKNQLANFQQFQNPYQNQQYQQANTQQLNTNQFGGQNGSADLGGIGRVGDTQYNTGSGIGSMGTSGYGDILGQLMKQGQGMLGPNGSGGGGAPSAGVGQGISLAAANPVDMSDPAFAAAQTLANRTTDRNAADLRARFGAQGAGAIGSGAQFAESNLRAEAAPQQILAMNQLIQQRQQQDLAERGTGANVALGSRGQDVQLAGMNLNAALQNQGMNQGNQQNILAQLLGSAGQGRAQDFQNQQANRGFDISQMGLGLNQAQGNQANQLAMRGQDLNSQLANQQMRNQFGFDAANSNNQNMQMNNSNSMNNANMQNQFNLNNAQNFAGNQQQTNGMNQQGYQNLLGMGQQNNQMSNQNMQQMLQNLFSGYQQSTGLGTPQAQTGMQQSGWGQALGAGLGIGGALLGGPAGGTIGGWLGNHLGGGGSGYQGNPGSGYQTADLLRRAGNPQVEQTGFGGYNGGGGGGGAMYNMNGGSPIPQGGGAMYSQDGGSPIPQNSMSIQQGGQQMPPWMSQFVNSSFGSPTGRNYDQPPPMDQGMFLPPGMFANSMGR